MDVHHTFKKMSPTEPIKTTSTAALEKLTKYNQGELNAMWVFSLDGENQVASLHLKGPQFDFFGEASTEDMYGSIEKAVQKVEKQLKKHKEMLKDHIHRR